MPKKNMEEEEAFTASTAVPFKDLYCPSAFVGSVAEDIVGYELAVVTKVWERKCYGFQIQVRLLYSRSGSPWTTCVINASFAFQIAWGAIIGLPSELHLIWFVHHLLPVCRRPRVLR